MKIELDLPVPEGWRFVGYQLPKKGQGYMASANSDFKIALEDFYSSSCFTFERIEPVDEELESARKKFPVGSWFKTSAGGSTIHRVERVDWETDDCRGFLVSDCTPFPLPTWRCCAEDKPKKDGQYVMRIKGHAPYKYRVRYYSLGVKLWRFNHEDVAIPEGYEWLDEGER